MTHPALIHALNHRESCISWALLKHMICTQSRLFLWSSRFMFFLTGINCPWPRALLQICLSNVILSKVEHSHCLLSDRTVDSLHSVSAFVWNCVHYNRFLWRSGIWFSRTSYWQHLSLSMSCLVVTPWVRRTAWKQPDNGVSPAHGADWLIVSPCGAQWMDCFSRWETTTRWSGWIQKSGPHANTTDEYGKVTYCMLGIFFLYYMSGSLTHGSSIQKLSGSVCKQISRWAYKKCR